jgi:hypothetical protein
LEIKLLLDAGVFPKDKIVEELKEKEFIHVEEGLFGPVKTLSIISYLETFFILVQTTNKYIHNHFLDLNFKIPLLAMNRPNDSFLVEDGIDYKGLGVKEFIVGHCGFGENKSFPEEYFKHPDFVFQTRGDENNYFEDLANLYSLKQS